MTLLLIMIYVSFISLGLPDSLLGASWPTMHADLNAPVALAGALSMVCSCATIASSLISTRLINRYGTGKVTLFSTALTAVSLVGYAMAPSPLLMFLAAIPLGLGGGGVDAGLNSYVALHYEPKHMSWLHCFWGVGAMSGSLILSACIGLGVGWRGGYWACVILQGGLALALGCTQHLWKHERPAAPDAPEAIPQQPLSNAQALRLPGMKAVLITFLCYCTAEVTMILWTATYAVQARSVTTEQAALLSSLFYGGITVGRLLNGFLAIRYSSRVLIRAGSALMLLGIALLFLPMGYGGLMVAVGVIGLGCAPIYPCTIQETPNRFGVAASQAGTALQMATAYTGSTFLPPVMGLISNHVGLGIFPWWMLVVTLVMFLTSEMVNQQTKKV